MSLIDKDSLIEHMRKAYEGNKKNGFKWDIESTVVVIECEEEINRPIVRCKDCKYMKVHGWNPKKEVSTCHYHCEFWNHAVDDCDFCSRGEKKDATD